MKYDSESIDSKITLLLERQDTEKQERITFRTEVMGKLKEIEDQTRRTNGRVTKLESHESAQMELNAKVIPLVEAGNVAKGTWFSIRNLFLGLAFVLGLVGALKDLW